MYGFEVEDSQSKGRISKLRHFIRQKRLFATKGYFPCGIGIELVGQHSGENMVENLARFLKIAVRKER